MKNNLPVIVFAVSSLSLTACAQLTNFTKSTPNTTTEKCLQMKREMILRENDMNHDAGMITRQQQQAYTKRYEAMCR